MIDISNEGKRVAASLKADINLLIYFAPPFFFGWVGTGVFVPFLWWVFLAGLALLTEYRPSPDYNELKWRPIAFGIALVAFVAIYYVARWLAP